MPERAIVPIPFPIQGLNKRWALGNQPPLTTPSCFNVRPDGAIDGRTRGGSRPGLQRQYATAPNIIGTASNDPIRMLGSVRGVSTDDNTFWEDSFNEPPSGDLSGVWSKPVWLAGEDVISQKVADLGKATSSTSPDVADVVSGALRSQLTDFDATERYSVSMEVLTELYTPPAEGSAETKHTSGRYRIFLRVDDGTLNLIQNGVEIVIEVFIQNGNYGGEINRYVGGSLVENVSLEGGPNGAPTNTVFQAIVDGNDLQVFWKGNNVTPGGTYDMVASNGKHVGFGLETKGSDFGINGPFHASIGYFLVEYNQDITVGTFNKPRNFLVAASSDNLYAESPDVSSTELKQVSNGSQSGELSIFEGDLVHSRERAGTLYIADYGGDYAIIASGDLGSVANDGVSLTNSDGIDWTAIGLNSDDFTVKLTNHSVAPAMNDTYELSSFTDTTITLATSVGAIASASACSYSIQRHPKKYDPITETLSLWTNSDIDSDGEAIPTNENQIPIGCPLIAVYRDRLVLAGANDNPQQWYMSRQGVPGDWTFQDFLDDETDSESAVSGSVGDAGQTGEPLTALIPHSDDYLIFASRSSMWMLRGEITFGGQIDAITRTIGVVSKGAWSYGPAGEVYFLSRDGLYKMNPGAGIFPTRLSSGPLPQELINLDTNTYVINLAYDIEERGLHIFATRKDPADTNQGIHFWYDIDLNSFWPVLFDHTKEPTAVIGYESDTFQQAGVIIGTTDSRLYRFRKGATEDDGTTLNTSVMIGPIKMGSDTDKDGMLSELVCSLDTDSSQVAWELYVGDTAEEALDNAFAGTPVFTSGQFFAGLNNKYRPRAGGFAFVLKLFQDSFTNTWAIERIHAVIKSKGRQRSG